MAVELVQDAAVELAVDVAVAAIAALVVQAAAQPVQVVQDVWTAPAREPKVAAIPAPKATPAVELEDATLKSVAPGPFKKTQVLRMQQTKAEQVAPTWQAKATWKVLEPAQKA